MRYSLEKVGAVGVAKERDRVGHHPNVTSSAVEIRFTPFAVLVCHGKDLVVKTLSVRRLVCRVRVIGCAGARKQTQKRKSVRSSDCKI